MLAREMRLVGPSSSRPCPEKGKKLTATRLLSSIGMVKEFQNGGFFAQYPDCAAKLGLVG